jgi:hypothetical protein
MYFEKYTIFTHKMRKILFSVLGLLAKKITFLARDSK